MGEFDLTHEKRFLDLLGYTYGEKEYSLWTIFDDKGKEVGSIKSFVEDNDRKYTMIINSDTLNYNSTRANDNLNYFFKLKDGSEVWLDLDKYYDGFPYTGTITILSKKYGEIDFGFSKGSFETGIINARKDAVWVDYRYKINGYDVRESTYLRNKDYSDSNFYKSYDYELTYKQNDNEIVGYDFFGFTSVNEPDKLNIWERRFEDHNLSRIHDEAKEDEERRKKLSDKIMRRIPFLRGFRKFNIWKFEKDNTDYKVEYDKTVEDLAIEQQRGMEVFNIVRNIVNELLPFKESLFDNIVNENMEEFKLERFCSACNENVIRK